MEIISIVLLCVVLWKQYQLYKKLDAIQDIVTDYEYVEETIKKYKEEGVKAEYDRDSGIIKILDS